MTTTPTHDHTETTTRRPASARRRPHPAARARNVSAVASVAAVAGLTGVLAIGHGSFEETVGTPPSVTSADTSQSTTTPADTNQSTTTPADTRSGSSSADAVTRSFSVRGSAAPSPTTSAAKGSSHGS